LMDVAKETGLSYSFIAAMERGACKPSMESLYKIAPSLGVTPAELVSSKEFESDKFVDEVATEDLDQRELLLVMKKMQYMTRIERKAALRAVEAVQLSGKKKVHKLSGLGVLIREHRKRLGITQKDLASRSNLHFTAISRMEKDLIPSRETVIKVAEALGASSVDFLEAAGYGEENLSKTLSEVINNPRLKAVVKAMVDLPDGEKDAIISLVEEKLG
jgi:transcriptional regulator with XRE-family HTH domain